jgi:DNA-binding transcriptional LysR family regulator
VLARFRKQYPKVEITLTITNSADVMRRVLAGEVDLGFVGMSTNAPGLQVRPFAEDEIVLIVPPGHPLTRPRMLAQDLLKTETLIVREAGSGTRQVTEAHLAQLGVAPGQVLELSGCEAVKRAVGAGLGVAFASHYAIALETAHKLVEVAAIPELRLKRALAIVARKDARPSAALLALLALMGKGEGTTHARSVISH